MTEPKYNEETCIHAGELRAMGFEIEERIPDCAWVHRSALSNFEVSGDVIENADSKRLPSMSISLEITEPFHWVEVKGTFEV